MGRRAAILSTVALIALLVAVAIPGASSAHDKDIWYWSEATASEAMRHVMCQPRDTAPVPRLFPYCAEAAKIGVKDFVTTGEYVERAGCQGFDPPKASRSGAPLYKHFFCRVTITPASPRASRRVLVILHVLNKAPSLDRARRAWLPRNSFTLTLLS